MFHVPSLTSLRPGAGCLSMPPMGSRGEDVCLGSPSHLDSSLLWKL